jgi:hypothetical protein
LRQQTATPLHAVNLCRTLLSNSRAEQLVHVLGSAMNGTPLFGDAFPPGG